jgi:hypothetical protein
VSTAQNPEARRPSVPLDTVAGDWQTAAFSALVLASAVILLLGGRDYLVLALAVLPLLYLFRRPKGSLAANPPGVSGLEDGEGHTAD